MHRRSILGMAARAGLSLPALAAAFSRRAHADERPPRLVGLHNRGGWLGVSVSLRDLFWPADGERLRSGFVSQVVIRVEVYRDGDHRPIARADRHTAILFDLWDEAFKVRVVERQGPRDWVARSDAEAIDLATAFRAFPVTETSRLEPGVTYRLRFRADLNPISEDLVNEVKRWMARPPGQGRVGAGDSVFGSFVSIFVNPKLPNESERQLSFWSPPFRMGAP
jgi:hypothetical protein